jgi:hypothetical protein
LAVGHCVQPHAFHITCCYTCGSGFSQATASQAASIRQKVQQTPIKTATKTAFSSVSNDVCKKGKQPMSNYLVWMLLLMAVGFGVQMYLQRTYGRFSQIRNSRDLTGAEVARDILDANDLRNVRVEMVAGQLTDHYDPISKTVRLSEANYNQPSLAALAVAAHEVGHALQDAQGYPAIVARARFFPVLSLGTNLGPWLAMGGIFLQWLGNFRRL